MIAPDDSHGAGADVSSASICSPGLRVCTDCAPDDREGFARTSGSRSETSPLLRPPTLQQAIAERLVHEAHARGSTDNLAAVVIDLGLGSVADLRQALTPSSSARGSLHPGAAQLHGGPGRVDGAAAAARGQGSGSAGSATEQNDAAAAAVEHAVATLGPSSLIARPCGARRPESCVGSVLHVCRFHVGDI